MSVINTNVSALYSQNALKTNTRSMNTAMEQLSTGTRINSAKDDAAGLAIGQNMTSVIRGLNMAVRNLNDAVNMVQTADGAMIEQTNMLQRMRELAVQASNGTNSTTQASYLNIEFQALSSQISSISSQTTWNGMNLLNSNQTFTYQSGATSGQTISVVISSMSTSSLGIGSASISSTTSAASSIATLDTAMNSINSMRATLGASINQMSYAADNLANVSANTTASRSSIMDTDYAMATTQLAKNQIIQQAATAMLAQANQQPSSVMALLK